MTTIVVYFKINFSSVNFVGILASILFVYFGVVCSSYLGWYVRVFFLKQRSGAVFQGIGGKIGRTQLIKSDRCQNGVDKIE